MKKLLSLLLVCWTATTVWAAKTNKMVNIKVGNETRKYLLYVPNSVKENAPLIISLHGAGGTVSTSSHDPDFNSLADKDGFIVAYPQGKQTTFPGLGGMQAPGWSSFGEENFDTDFLKAVVEDVNSKYTVDRQRLYCCGFSNGGMMTYVMANTCSHIFAAFAAISGYPINEFHLHHTSWRPVPFLHIHGKADDFVKYSLVPNVIDNMVARNGANPVPEVTKKSGKYTKSVYEAGEGGFPIIFYEIDGMGHSPFTNNTEDSNSSKTMWNFFQQYTLDSPCDTTLKWCPRIETEGYEPKKHGWTMNSGTTLLKFGGTQNTNSNQNVYRSLQFQTGKYTLSFNAQGDAEKTIRVKIEKLTGKKNAVLDSTIHVGAASLPFEVSDGWGEYKLTLTRAAKEDEITVSDVKVTTFSEVPTGIQAIRDEDAVPSSRNARSYYYNLSGQRVQPNSRGLIIQQTQRADGRIVSRKVMP